MHYKSSDIIRKFDAVIFDMDGTLIDSMWVWGSIDVEYLRKYGFSVPDDLQKEIGGKSALETALYFQNRFGIKETVQDMMKCWDDMAMTHYSSDVRLKKGAFLFLQFCRSSGLHTAIATSSTRSLMETVLRNNDILDCFDAIVTGDEITTGKPEPDLYLEAAKRVKTLPEKCIVFEDILDGVKAGKNAGMTVIVVKDEYGYDSEEKLKAESDGYIEDFSELFEKKTD